MQQFNFIRIFSQYDEFMTDKAKIEVAKEECIRDLAKMLVEQAKFTFDPETNCVRGYIRLE